MKLVTVYRANKVDQVAKERPRDLAEDFVATCEGVAHQDHTFAGHLDIEFQYRWWLTGPRGKNLTWDESEWPAIWKALTDLLNSDPEAKELVLKAIDPFEN